MTAQHIVHIIPLDEYMRVANEEVYRPESLTREGFIHFSTPEQAAGVANLFYADRGELLLLVVDPALLGDALVFEAPIMPGAHAAPAPGMFPHLYAPLDLSLLYAIIAWSPGADGRYAEPRIVTADV
jgi:uncharacterized protein (DUF952 family)